MPAAVAHPREANRAGALGDGERDGVPVLRGDEDALEAGDVLAGVADEVRMVVTAWGVCQCEAPEMVPEVVPCEEATIGEAHEHPVDRGAVEREAPYGREHFGVAHGFLLKHQRREDGSARACDA